MEFLATTDPDLAAEQLVYFLNLLDGHTGTPPPGWVHASVAGFVLTNGGLWAGSPLPDTNTLGPPRECFANAARLAGTNGLTYAEGWATPSDVPLPIEHAWCVDPATGTVVDPTWERPGVIYAGVALDVGVLNDHLARTTTFGVLVGDYLAGHPAVRGLLPTVDPHLLGGVSPREAGGA